MELFIETWSSLVILLSFIIGMVLLATIGCLVCAIGDHIIQTKYRARVMDKVTLCEKLTKTK